MNVLGLEEKPSGISILCYPCTPSRYLDQAVVDTNGDKILDLSYTI